MSAVTEEARARLNISSAPVVAPKLLLTEQLVSTLEKIPGVNSVKLTAGSPCDKLSITSWEQRHCCLLPTDLKNFYLANDGMRITWRFKLKMGEHLSLGCCQINCLNDLKRLGAPSAHQEAPSTPPVVTSSNISLDLSKKDQSVPLGKQKELESDPLVAQGCSTQARAIVKTHPAAYSPQKCKIFELDSNRGQGTVCLVYGIRPKSHAVSPVPSPDGNAPDDKSFTTSSPKQHFLTANGSKHNSCPTPNEPEIWFLDQSDDWHFLAGAFTEYYRMMLLHLGLPFWQNSFTPQGLPREAKVWFHHFIPRLLDHEAGNNADNSRGHGTRNDAADESLTVQCNQLDPAIFKIKSKHAAAGTPS